jgi:glutaredoxin
MQTRNHSIFRSIEKIGYGVSLSGVFAFCGYKLYQKNVLEVQKRALELRDLENKFITQARENIKKAGLPNEDVNILKLQDFKKKIYAIGVYDDPLSLMVETKGLTVNAPIFDKK